MAELGAHTVREQAELTGIPIATLARIRGTNGAPGSTPSLDKAMTLAEALHIPVLALFSRDGEVSPE